MRRYLAAVFAAGILSCALPLEVTASTLASDSSSHRVAASSTKGTSTHRKPAARKASKKKATGAARDAHGRIARSEAAKDQFMRQTGYPHGRPGYVVDHIVPLACGGADIPSNMQWQRVAAAKAKDRVERQVVGCR